jgi:hypothetical protein
MDVIAEHRLVVLYPDGELVPVYLRIGRPGPHPKGDFVCPVQAEGLRLWKGPAELAGVDTLHALMIALRFLHDMLSSEVERGAVLHWEGGNQSLQLSDLFGMHEGIKG